MVVKPLLAAMLVASALCMHAAASALLPAYSKPWVNSCRSGYSCKWPPTNWRPPRPTKPSTTGCPPGFGYVSLGTNGVAQCIACESGTYSRGGTSICLQCGQGSGFATLQKATSAEACVCYAGYGGVACTMCKPGTFSPGVYKMASGRSGRNFNPRPPCRVCPDNTLGSTKPGAASVKDCGGCIPGYGGEQCTICPPGTYTAGGSYAECTPCGDNQTSWPGAEAPTWCQCKAGTGNDGDGNCITCPADTWWPGPPEVPVAQVAAAASKKSYLEPCMACPSNTTSTPGSTSIDDCVKM